MSIWAFIFKKLGCHSFKEILKALKSQKAMLNFDFKRNMIFLKVLAWTFYYALTCTTQLWSLVILGSFVCMCVSVLKSIICLLTPPPSLKAVLLSNHLETRSSKESKGQEESCISLMLRCLIHDTRVFLAGNVGVLLICFLIGWREVLG